LKRRARLAGPRELEIERRRARDEELRAALRGIRCVNSCELHAYAGAVAKACGFEDIGATARSGESRRASTAKVQDQVCFRALDPESELAREAAMRISNRADEFERRAIEIARRSQRASRIRASAGA
jgi:hypothetical protein